jgi:aspartate-semialdehyde dehydrogenase
VKPVCLALVGATGLVGRTTLDVLSEWRVPLNALRLFASDGSAGREMQWQGRTHRLERLDHAPTDVEAAIFATSRTISLEWVPRFRDAGMVVIDHSAAFRMNPDVPLVIPEVNGDALRRHRGIISNPNCSASVVVIPLAALDRAFELKTVVADTYQSVSGSGQDAVTELEAELADASYAPRVYPRLIAGNVFPQVGPFDDEGLCDEECKVIEELQKMLDRPGLAVFTTTVRVPVRVGHSAAVTVECRRPVDRASVEAAWRDMPGMIYDAQTYHTPREIAGRQEIFVSRLRLRDDDPHWLQFWAVGDNLRKGAASNAVQILMELFRD